MKTLPRAMTSGEEDRAARYADDCARTLLAYYAAENAVFSPSQPAHIERTWRDHEAAVDQFEAAFPRLEWRDFAEPSLLKAIEENRP